MCILLVIFFFDLHNKHKMHIIYIYIFYTSLTAVIYKIPKAIHVFLRRKTYFKRILVVFRDSL